MQKDLLFAMYMGGPDSLDAIEPFLYNLFSDRTIINFHVGGTIQKFIAKKIAKSRSVKVAPEYEKMGGSSPQLKYMKLVLKKVQDMYKLQKGRELDVQIGMCYYHPYIDEAVREASKNEYGDIYVMTMYPQHSYTTAGACFDRFNKEIAKTPLKGNIKIIEDWHMNNKYNQCIIDRIFEAAEKLGKPIGECHIQFSAHSLPEYTIRRKDKYTKQIKEQIEHIINAVQPLSHGLSYQSRTGPVKWIAPFTDEELMRLTRRTAEGKKDTIIVVPISFVSDHIETLIELDEQYIPLVSENGTLITRMESLNDSDDFAESLYDVITGEKIEQA